jgi:hypothetical protein
LILCIFADGIKRLPPKLVFHGKEHRRIEAEEDRQANKNDQRLTWEYNSKAYNIEKSMSKWLEEKVNPVLSSGANGHLEFKRWKKQQVMIGCVSKWISESHLPKQEPTLLRTPHLSWPWLGGATGAG